MMQGDACYLGITILNNAGTTVTADDVQDVEITLGPMTKSYRAEELSYAAGVWLFPLSQGESFSCPPGQLAGQVRVAWANGVVEGCRLYGMHIEESISKEVL